MPKDHLLMMAEKKKTKRLNLTSKGGKLFEIERKRSKLNVDLEYLREDKTDYF